MSVKSKVVKALSTLDVDVCFLERDDDGTFPFVVFNISEVPVSYADDEEDMTLFLVTINIFSRPEYNFETLKIKILELMKAAGFRKTKIPNAEFMEEEMIYNQPMGFSYFE